MGAADFEAIGLGQTVSKAFVAAVQDAQYEYGHGGYTGTIAEKGDFELFVLPPRVDPFKVARSAWQAESMRNREEHPEWYARCEKPTAEERKALSWLRDRLGKAQADRIIDRITGDKWGPCAAFEVKGSKATEIKRRHGRAGTRDKVFLFVGLASE